MKFVCKSSVLFAGLLLVSFNSTNALAEITDGLSDGFKHPPMDNAAPQHKPSAASPMMQPEGPIEQGKVLELTTAAGYTYLLLESGGKSVWVAGTQVNANVGDTVSYIMNVEMHNFTSRSINRTFDHIIFASMVKVVE